MKRYTTHIIRLTALFILIVGVNGCTKIDDLAEANQGEQITISASVEQLMSTRASITNSSLPGNIGLYGFSSVRGVDELFDNQELTCNSELSYLWEWENSEIKYYLNNENINYFAYSPYSESITETIDSDNGTLSFDYTINNENADTDLMLAGTVIAQSYVQLNFNHALSAIGFKLKGNASHKVTALSIHNVYSTGTVTVDNEGLISWSNQSGDLQSYDVSLDIETNEDGIAPTISGSEELIIGDDGYIFMIPQTLMWDASIEIKLCPIEGQVGTDDLTKYISLEGDQWQSGCVHYYTINIDDQDVTTTTLSTTSEEFKVAVNSANTAQYDSFILEGDILSSVMDFTTTALYNNSSSYINTVDLSGVRIYSDDQTETTSIDIDIFGSCPTITTLYAPNITDMTTTDNTSSIEVLTIGFTGSLENGNVLGNLKGTLKELYLPYLTTLGSLCLNWDFNALTTVYAPQATAIEGAAFCFTNRTYDDQSQDYRTSLIADIYFPNVETIGNSGFAGCTNLLSVDFPKVKTVGENAFYNCTSLATASFPELVTVGEYAFCSCTSLTELYLTANSTIAMGINAFLESTSSCTLYISSANESQATDATTFAGYTFKAIYVDGVLKE